MAINFSSVTLTSNPSNAGANLRISATVTDGNAAKWLMDSSSTYLRDSGGAYLLTTNTSGTSQLNYTATQVNNILANIDAYDDSADLSLYLTETDAANTYQTQTGASSNYLPKGSYQAAGTYKNYSDSVTDKGYIQNTFNSYISGTAIDLPVNTLYLVYNNSSSIDPNNFFSGTWEVLTNNNAKAVGTMPTSASSSVTLTTSQVARPSVTWRFTGSVSHTHAGTSSKYFIETTVGIARHTIKVKGGSSYYLPYCNEDSMTKVANTNTPTTSAGNWEHTHSTLTVTSSYTAASSTVSLLQAGHQFKIWRKTSS